MGSGFSCCQSEFTKASGRNWIWALLIPRRIGQHEEAKTDAYRHTDPDRVGNSVKNRSELMILWRFILSKERIGFALGVRVANVIHGIEFNVGDNL